MSVFSRRFFVVVCIFNLTFQYPAFGQRMHAPLIVAGVARGADIGLSLRELGRLAAAWASASFRAETIPAQALAIFGEVGLALGMTAQFVATNWEVISASLTQARAVLYCVPATTSLLASTAGRVTVSAGPTVLLALLVAGLIPPAIFRLRILALETNAQNEARLWQMDRKVYLDVFRQGRRERDHIRLPSFSNTADILVPGPSADEVAEGPIQNYINAAFIARANPTAGNRERAQTLLSLISNAASQPRPPSDWD